MKVKNMRSSRGNKVANQFILSDMDGNQFFQSYDSTIVRVSNQGEITLDPDYWDYSATTGKYRNIFLGEGIADTRKKIDSGEYKLMNLN